MDRPADIPDRYGDRHRPNDPSLWASSRIVLDYVLGSAVLAGMIVPVAYVLIGFATNRLPDVHTYVTYWMWAVAAGAAWGTWDWMRHYSSSVQACERYERDYRTWKTQQDQKDLERRETDRLRAERDAQEARQQREAQALKQAQSDRRRRLLELEGMVLQAQAQHAVGADFFGTMGSVPLLAEFRVHLRQLNLADLGILRESQHPVVRQIIGDASFLPPSPPLRLPSASPA